MFTLPDLDYNYDALGKYISKNIMELHHDKHHQTYVDKLNVALEKAPQLANKSIEELLLDLNSVPEEIRTAVRNHGGGHYNHTQFWKWMSPDGGGEPSGELGEALKSKYGSYQAFMDAFAEKALSVFGSGWAWLCVPGQTRAGAPRTLTIESTPNQDTLITASKVSILGIDVWEHAYYLKYHNVRADYIAAFFNVIDWDYVASNYEV